MGDSDVGKQEILSGLEDGSIDSPYCSSTGAGKVPLYVLIAISYRDHLSLQDHDHPDRREEGEAAVVGHFRPGKVLHYHQVY